MLDSLFSECISHMGQFSLFKKMLVIELVVEFMEAILVICSFVGLDELLRSVAVLASGGA